MVSYSRLMEESEAQALHLLGEFRQTARQTIQEYSGEIIDTVGDGFFAAFGSAVMTEEIPTRLSKIRELKVASRSTVLRYKGSGIDPREVGRELGVGSVLEGSVRKLGNRLRITAQLINAVDGFHLWSEAYDRNLDDVFKIQDEVSEKIAEVLRLNLTEAERVQLSAVPTQIIEAYDYYSRGKHLFYQYTREG